MKSKFLVGTGLIMIAAAVFLMICNVREERKAGETAENMVIQMESLEAELPERLTSESEELVPEYKKNPEMEMPTVEINGQECIGTLEIPSLGLKFPVISEYRTHFSGIKHLKLGDEVRFSDTVGNMFLYEVSEIETIDEHNIGAMETGEWDLTLFTCTKGGRARVAVRCTE